MPARHVIVVDPNGILVAVLLVPPTFVDHRPTPLLLLLRGRAPPGQSHRVAIGELALDNQGKSILDQRHQGIDLVLGEHQHKLSRLPASTPPSSVSCAVLTLGSTS